MFRVLSRRELLRVGTFGSLGILSPPARSARACRIHAPGFGRAKRVLLLITAGGQSQLETWDPKPNAPIEIRGAFGSIQTSLPGVRIGEHLPRTARMLKKLTLVRSLTHDDLDHGSALYAVLTGHFHPRKSSNPPPRRTDFPQLAGVLTKVRPLSQLPYTAVNINGPVLVPELVAPGQFGGFLGRGVEPLVIRDPSAHPLAALHPETMVPSVRLEERVRLRDSLARSASAWERSGLVRERSRLEEQALALLTSSVAQRAFDLSEEPARLRDRFGRHMLGTSCLLARRLLEAGIPLVTVFCNRSIRGQDADPSNSAVYGWDTHNDIFSALKDHLLPSFDQAFSALIADCDERGLLADTLVICLGEFGRAPKVALEPGFKGSAPGRKHWAGAYSALFAGAGVQAGAVYGASDTIAGSVKDRPLSPPDIAATIFHALGLDPTMHYTDNLGRPFPLSVGRPVTALFGGV